MPVLFSGKRVSQLLTATKISSATAESQAAAVFETIQDREITDNNRAICFDTTSSNTGYNSSACVLIEQKLKKELLLLACSNYIMELIISTLFEICIRIESLPEVALFKRFQEYWSFIDKDKYKPGNSCDDVVNVVGDIKQETINYAKKYLKNKEKQNLELIIKNF